MSIKCPFLVLFFSRVNCPYLEGELCDDIETCPGNSDAWCTKQAEDLEQITEVAKALCEKFVGKVESGKAQSRETYAECKKLLEIINEQKEGESEINK